MPHTPQNRCLAVLVPNRYSLRASSPATRRKRGPGTMACTLRFIAHREPAAVVLRQPRQWGQPGRWGQPGQRRTRRGITCCQTQVPRACGSTLTLAHSQLQSHATRSPGASNSNLRPMAEGTPKRATRTGLGDGGRGRAAVRGASDCGPPPAASAAHAYPHLTAPQWQAPECVRHAMLVAGWPREGGERG